MKIVILLIGLYTILNANPASIDFNVPYKSSASNQTLTSNVDSPTIGASSKYIYPADKKRIDLTIPIIIVLFLFMMIGIAFLPRDKDEEVIEDLKLGDLRYAFEHKYLPLWLFDNPFNIINYLLDYREEGIFKWWNMLRNDPIAYRVLDAKLDMDDVAVFYTVKENVGYMIIKMPQPKIKGDSYYIGLIVPQERPLTKTRYFSLEYAIDKNNNPTTNLFERTVDNTCVDYGNIVDQRVDLFEKFLELIFIESYKLPKSNSFQNKICEL